MNDLHSPGHERYDRLTQWFHWLTAATVIFLFASAHIWENLAKGTDLRRGLQSVHISLGIALAVLIVLRIVWRVFVGTHLPAHGSPATRLLARLGHLALYGLLLAQIALGFMFRWAQGERFEFFGLFAIPSPLATDHDFAHVLGGLHDKVAWVIIILAGLHACAALIHHAVLKDPTLRRMLPVPRR